MPVATTDSLPLIPDSYPRLFGEDPVQRRAIKRLLLISQA